MAKKEFFLVLDVETANFTQDPLVYDLGFQVIDRKGNVYESESFIIYDIFVLEKDLMQSAYYAEKIPSYEAQIKAKNSRLVQFSTARKILLSVIKKYDIRKVGAYNAAFDRNALNTTLRYITKSEQRYFFPYEIEWFCIWHMACQTILSQKKFFKTAEKNNWFSPSKNLLTNAEVCFRYMEKDPSFSEEHKGLQDVEIECKIFLKVLSQKKKVNWSVNRSCWRIPNKAYKALSQ